MMAEHGTVVVPTIANAYHIIHDGPQYGMVGEGFGFFDSVGFGRVVEAFRALLKHGVPIAMGSDCGGSEAHRHGHNLLELPFYVRYGMTPDQAIQSATINAARLLQMDDQIGSVESGKIADLVVLERNPLEDISAVLDGAAQVYKEGTLVYDRERDWLPRSPGLLEAGTAVTGFEPDGAKATFRTWSGETY